MHFCSRKFQKFLSKSIHPGGICILFDAQQICYAYFKIIDDASGFNSITLINSLILDDISSDTLNDKIGRLEAKESKKIFSKNIFPFTIDGDLMHKLVTVM